MNKENLIAIRYDDLYQLVDEILYGAGLSKAHAAAVSQTICKAERDQCYSHGIYRIRGVLKSLQAGLARGDAEVSIDNPGHLSVIKVNAHGGFSCLAFERGAPLLAEKAKQYGIAAMAIQDCVHFSALWPEVEMLAEQGVAALAMCPSAAYVAPTGGTAKLLGTNPFAFAWPRQNDFPYVFDFATSVVARGEVELYRLQNKLLPTGWAIDSSGQPTTHPQAALEGALLTFGGYKGSALSTMIELLAGAWIGDLLSMESTALDEGRGLSPRHGELLIAFNPTVFNQNEVDMRAEKLFDAFQTQGARLPSQRRYQARMQSEQSGIVISLTNFEKLQAMKNGNYQDEIF